MADEQRRSKSLSNRVKALFVLAASGVDVSKPPFGKALDELAAMERVVGAYQRESRAARGKTFSEHDKIGRAFKDTLAALDAIKGGTE